MDFLAWHYSEGIAYYIKSVEATLKWFWHYFSIPLLVRTLFSPWKRMVTADTSPGFNLQKRFEAFSFNAVSVVIGFLARVTLIFSGLIFMALATLGGAVGILFWLVLPFFSLEVYTKYKRQPGNYVKDLLAKAELKKETFLKTLFSSEAGEYTLAHVGISQEELLAGANPGPNLSDFTAGTFSEVIRILTDVKKIWSEKFLRSKGFLANDLVLAASLWDRRSLEANKIGGVKLGRPGLALELTFGYTPTLDKYVSDMAVLRDFSHHLIGRVNIVARMERVLTSGGNIILTGVAGVGKKTVIYEFAQKAAHGTFGRAMSYKRVLEFDYTQLLSESTDINQKKALLAQIFAEAGASGNVILVIKDIQRLINKEVEGLDFMDIVEEHLRKKNLKIIAVSEKSDYDKFLAPLTRFSRFFEKVEVVPPSKEEAMEILIEASAKWERASNVVISVPAMREIMEGSDEYITDTPFPEKTLELLDSIVTYKEQKGSGLITPEDVKSVLSEKTGIALSAISKKDKSKLSKIEDLIHESLVNQDSAVDLIGKTIRAKTVGVIKEGRPLGSFLFLGPTGVGKTETAKVLAKVYFGSSDNIIRFDMAEFSGTEGLERLIGSVSKNLPGGLTTSLKNKPSSLLLLDEIEKSGKDVLNLFLTLLDEGFVTDAFGKKVSGKHVFVIATSNGGSEFIRESIAGGMSGDELQKRVLEHVLSEKIFSPEFINRFDGVIVYEPLSREDLVKVADLMLSQLSLNLKSKNISLKFSPGVREKLAEEGFDPIFGARPMRRLVNLILGDLIGKAILEGVVKEGDNIKILPGLGKKEFRIEKIN